MNSPKSNASIWNRLFVLGKPLPGIIQSIAVGGKLRMDVEGVAGQDGVVIGNADWSEDTATFQFLVPSGELKRMQEFRAAYKNKPGIKPEPVTVGHPLLKEMGITKMILVGLEINWNNGMKNTVPVTVQLTNITPKKDPVVTDADGFVSPTDPNLTGSSSAGTTPPTSSKPGSTGLAESNEITGQPAAPQPKAPTKPGPARTAP